MERWKKITHRSGSNDCGMCTTTIGSFLDICDNILGRGEIYPVVSTESFAEFALFVASINGDNATAHVLCILYG